MYRKKVYSSEFKIAKIQEFETGELSQREFCRINDINYFTFHEWLRKYRENEGSVIEDEQTVKAMPLIDVREKLMESNPQPQVQRTVAKQHYLHIRISGTDIEVLSSDLPVLIEALKHD